MRDGLPGGQEKDVLELLMRDPRKELYGLEMVRLEPKKLGRTSIYVVLTRMVAFALIEARLETDEEQKVRGPKRRLYKITDYGRQMLKARLEADRAAAKVIKMGGVLRPEGALR